MDARIIEEIAGRPEHFVFATVTGAALYGLPADDEADVRACHVLPAADVVGLRTPPETLAYTAHRDGLDVEVVSHDIRKFCLLLLKKNGNVLEHVLSPLVVHTSPAHEELRDIARLCPSTHMAHHFESHARMLWQLFEERGTVRTLLMALRVLLTGTHLMRTGEIETDLNHFGLAGRIERCDEVVDPKEHVSEYELLRAALRAARDASPLPPQPPAEARERLHDLLVRVRLGESA